jgi:hypothetical protein
MRVCCVLGLLLPVGGPAALLAQPADTHPAHDPQFTLATWAERMWLTILDRDGGYYGRIADQGILQRFNPRMNDEYELDIWAGVFSPGEDARWALARRGVRAAGTSINHPNTLTHVDWRHESSVAGPVDFLAVYARRESFTEQRDHLRLGVRWRNAMGSGLGLQAGLGVHFFKPSGDIEIGIGREWFGDRNQAWRAELRFAFLDAMSNVVFNRLGVRPEEADAHLDYATVRYAAGLGLARTAARYRAELHAGGTTRSRADVAFPVSGAPGYRLTEQVGFLGASAEARIASWLAAGIYGTLAHAATDRTGAPDAGRALRLRETTRSAGAHAWAELARWEGLGVEVHARAVWRPEAREAEGLALRHEDREVLVHVGLARRPRASGWQWRLAYVHLDREAGELAPPMTAVNNRNVMEAGYRFGSGFEMAGGVRWDLERLGGGAFDGGHLRVMATW